MRNAQVNPHIFIGERQELFWDFTGEDNIPLVTFPFNGAGFDFSSQWAMHHQTNRTNVREFELAILRAFRVLIE